MGCLRKLAASVHSLTRTVMKLSGNTVTSNLRMDSTPEKKNSASNATTTMTTTSKTANASTVTTVSRANGWLRSCASLSWSVSESSSRCSAPANGRRPKAASCACATTQSPSKKVETDDVCLAEKYSNV